MSVEIDRSKELVLVVDDEEIIREPVGEMLAHLGFTVCSAENGQECLKLLHEHEQPFTFLLTDVWMPGLDGLELIGRVKKEFPRIVIIAMTGFSYHYNYMDVVNAGAVDFINKPFTIRELEAKITRALEERNIREELGRLSITDDLTGLHNQRHFYARLHEEVKRAERQESEFSLILLDLDRFKLINDKYGHLKGDRLLARVGGVIGASIRQGVDMGFRYGGDEFAVILIDTNAGTAEGIGHRIAQLIQDDCNLSASVGCACYQNGMTPEDLVDAADRNLYKAKGSEGRADAQADD